MRTSCTLPLDPPLNILSSIRLDGRTLYSTENGSLILEIERVLQNVTFSYGVVLANQCTV